MGLSFEYNAFSCGHHQYRNNTYQWISSDSKKTYDENIKNPDRYDMMKKYGWIDADISYKFNNYGFRCPEFDYGDSILFLGCSFTVGVGVPIDHTFAHLVSHDLGMNNCNLGLVGATPDGAFKVGDFWIKKLRPKIVIYGVHGLGGFEVFLNAKGRRKLLMRQSKPGFEGFYKLWLDNPINGILRERRNRLALEMLSQRVGAKFIKFNVQSYLEGDSPIHNCPFHLHDYSRDFGHFGTKTNRFVADYLLQLINEDNI